MKLFPEYACNIKSNLSPEQVIKLISNNMNIIDLKTHKVMGKSKLFTGYIENMNFEMEHEIIGSNSGNPKITGKVKEDENGSIIELKFSLFSKVKVILLMVYFFLFFLFLVTFTIFIVELVHNKVNIIFIGVILFFSSLEYLFAV